MNNPNSDSLSPSNSVGFKTQVNWKQIGIFILITFGLTWALDLVLYLNGGLTSPVAYLALQFEMLLPAFSAMFLGVFFFKESPIYLMENHSKSRWFIWYFFLITFLYLVSVVIGLLRPELIRGMNSIMLIPSVIGLLLLVILRVVGGKDSFAGAGMAGGKVKYWFLFGLGIIALAGLQTLLSWLFKMGQPVDLGMLKTQAAMSGLTFPVLMIVLSAQTLILGPFLGLLITFGEEYGWRGYLQPALIRMGKFRGIALVGIIWGIWHWPVIWMGYNYPGHPYLGSLLMVLFSIGLAFLLGYAVLKSKGIWISAFLHALVNQSFGFFMGIIYKPNDAAFSFGIGFPGLIVVALLILLILRDPLWKESD